MGEKLEGLTGHIQASRLCVLACCLIWKVLKKCLQCMYVSTQNIFYICTHVYIKSFIRTGTCFFRSGNPFCISFLWLNYVIFT